MFYAKSWRGLVSMLDMLMSNRWFPIARRYGQQAMTKATLHTLMLEVIFWKL
jgi:hypothetical protein